MQSQIKMEETMLMAHRGFMQNLEKAIDILDKDISEAAEMTQVCTDEWCSATEHVVDDLHKSIYSISEPRWLTEDDSKKIRELRRRVHDIYNRYRNIKA
ncbi:MAG: hypothetical protein LC633_03180 [Desulfobulbaceae bacterium]|nr:hypothetical protein [Desulfobulbaceae bacterium]